MQVTVYGRQSVPDWAVVRSCDPLHNFGAPIISLERLKLKSSFVPPFGGLRGNVHGSSMARWKARSRLLALIELFSPAITIEALCPNIGRHCTV